jgi:hypothetical protein
VDVTDGWEIVVAERDVQRQLVRFARAMDQRDWSTLRALCVPGATADLGTGLLRGADAIVALIARYLDACGPTQHLLGSVLVDVDLASGVATSRAYVSDLHLGRGERRHLTFSTIGDYHDDWERHDRTWLLRHRTKLTHGTIGSMDVFDFGDQAP